jgi:large subunit ribosomal protein L15
MGYLKRKKSTRFRGNTTHGYGSMKKHRGAGHRGGVGRAGTGKRADSKKPNVWKLPKYMGKHGFRRKNSFKISAVNIAYLEEKFNELEINLGEHGFNKLLGNGKPTRKYKLKVDFASRTAIEKIVKAGGTVELKVQQKASAANEEATP